jgi:hypothetical protein
MRPNVARPPFGHSRHARGRHPKQARCTPTPFGTRMSAQYCIPTHPPPTQAAQPREGYCAWLHSRPLRRAAQPDGLCSAGKRAGAHQIFCSMSSSLLLFAIRKFRTFLVGAFVKLLLGCFIAGLGLGSSISTPRCRDRAGPAGTLLARCGQGRAPSQAASSPRRAGRAPSFRHLRRWSSAQRRQSAWLMKHELITSVTGNRSEAGLHLRW